MKALKFLGIDSGFGFENNSAYAVENNNLLLIDCGGTVFGKLLMMDQNNGFLKTKDRIDIIITHLHDDHVGSLSTLILYCKYVLNKKPVIYTKCQNIRDRMQICGVLDDFYEVRDYSDKIEFVKTLHDVSLDCYGFKLDIDGKKILYTGDTSTFQPFIDKLDGVSEIYIDTNIRKNSAHIYLEDNLEFLKELVNQGYDVYLMHTDDKEKTKELIANTGVNLADEDKLYKDDIIRILHEYNLDPNRYVVVTGAAMVLYGMKEFTRDIDISVSKDYYNELLSQYKCTFERVDPFGECIFFIDDIINFGTTYYSNEINNIDGIPVLNEERLINIKELLGRDKDINDLSIIKR